MPKVSVLIPVYNVEKYLEQCVRSAMDQTLRDIEIICLNDGSTDGSSQILHKLAGEDSRIIVVEKKNTGYGHTMNMGIRMAKGKYLVFLESDDFILPDMCRRMYEVCEKHSLEVLKTDYYAFLMNGSKVCKRYRKVSHHDNYHKVLDATRQREVFLSDRYTWLCMYLKEYLWKNEILHNETPGAAYQDNGFWFQSMMYCRRVYYLDEAFYMYRMDNPNASIRNRKNIHSFAGEYAFIRKKILEFDGEKRELFTLAGIIDFRLHLWSTLRVAPEYLKSLAVVFQQEMKVYFQNELFDFRMLNVYDAKQFLIGFANIDTFCQCVEADIAERQERYRKLVQGEMIILYGAGKIASRVMQWIDELFLWNRNLIFAVTEPEKTEPYFQGNKVQRMSDLTDYREVATVVLCTVSTSQHYKVMKENLLQWGFQHIVYADELLTGTSWHHGNPFFHQYY